MTDARMNEAGLDKAQSSEAPMNTARIHKAGMTEPRMDPTLTRRPAADTSSRVRLAFLVVAVAAGVAVMTIAALYAPAARAADPYPNHVIRLVVPFPPGGGNDALGRLVAQRLSTTLGQQVIVENRAGAQTGTDFQHVLSSFKVSRG